MNKSLLLGILLMGGISVAQQNEASVGINTDEPQATLDVSGKPEDTSKMDGIIAPRITGDLLNAKTYTTSQKGALIYVTEAAEASKQIGQTINVKASGYYYFDGSLWVKINPEQAPNNDWQLTGNSKTDAKINFLGTTDEQPLVIKTNNIRTGYIGVKTNNKVDRNIAFGEGTLSKVQEDESTAYRNVAIGYNALQNVTHSSNNVAIGAYALQNQVRGAEGKELFKQWGSNVAIGLRAMQSSTQGMWNVGIGELALGGLTTGWQNVAIGNRALEKVTTGGRNTALGSEALNSLKTGVDNMAIGLYALHSLVSGVGNQSVGWRAGEKLTQGDNNIILGYEAASKLTSGSSNFIVGKGVNIYTETSSNQMNLGNLIYGVGFLTSGEPQKVGIATGTLKKPTETLHIDGTIRVTGLPNNGQKNAIYTKSDGSSSSQKDQTFTAVKTVVVDANGVLGTIDGLPTPNTSGRRVRINDTTMQDAHDQRLEKLYLHVLEQDKALKVKDAEIKELKSDVLKLKSLVQKLMDK